MARYDLPFAHLAGRVAGAIVLGALILAVSRTASAQFCQRTELSFDFSAEPAQPRVGDLVTLTVQISQTNTAGLPHVSLEGTAPFLGGDLTPDPPVSPSGPVPGSVVYHLTAVEAGEATLVFRITFEGVTGCSEAVGQIFGYLAATSQPFTLVIGPAGEGTVGPPTFTPTPTPTETVFRPTATITATPAGSPTSTPSPVLGCYLTTLGFTLSAEPPHPKVGDAIVLTIAIDQIGGTAGLPAPSLEGASPLLAGGSMPDPPVSMSGPVPSSVTYHLTALAAGDATLTFHLGYEGVTACSPEVGPVYGFLFASSDPPFVLHIGAADEPMPTPTATPSQTPTAPPGVALNGGCALSTQSGSLGWLLAAAALVAVQRRRRRPPSTASIRRDGRD